MVLSLGKLSLLFSRRSIHGYLRKQPSKRERIDDLLLCYRAYTRRIRKMLFLGGVLHDRKHSSVWLYIISFFLNFICFGQCMFVLNFCRDHTDNLVLLSKCFGLICSFISPILMVSHVLQLCRKYHLQVFNLFYKNFKS